MAFYCSQKLHGCNGMLRLLGQYFIVVTSSRWVLPVVTICPLGSLEHCHLPLQLLLINDFWRFVLLFLLDFCGDSLVELTVLCNSSWFLLCTLLRLFCQGCALLIVPCPMPSVLSIIPSKLLSSILLIWFHWLCVNVVSIDFHLHHNILIAFALSCWEMSYLIAEHFTDIIYFYVNVSHFFGGLGSSRFALPSMFSPSFLLFSFNFFDLTPQRCFFMWPFWVSLESGQYFWTADVVRLGHAIKFPALIASIHVSLTGNPAAAWRYVIDCRIDCNVYILFASSLIWLFCFADTIHSFSWLLLHPWRTGGLLVVMVSVPFLWIHTPSSPEWNIVVYPSSDIFYTYERLFKSW